MPPSPCRYGKAGPGARRLLAAGLLAAALAGLAGCGTPHPSADCDQLLSDRKFQEVLSSCDNPVDRASAYLGLAGFDMFTLLESGVTDGNVVPILGLTPGNIAQRRQYLEQAVQSVNPPEGPTQAFALLLSAFLGLGTSTEEYLDPNLDGTVSQAEATAAVGATPSAPVVAAASPTPGSLYFSVVVNGKPYLFDCSVDPTCVAATVYDDPDGTGRLTTAIGSGLPSADAATVLASEGSATAVGYPVEIFIAAPLLTFSVSATQDLPGFLGVGGAGGRFAIGLNAYLQGISAANAVLTASGGQPGGSAVTANVNALVSKFDNGAACVAAGIPPFVTAAAGAKLVAYLNALYALYAASAGTTLQPVPPGAGASYFMTRNLVSNAAQIRTDIDAFFAALGVPLFFPQIPSAAYGFPGGQVTKYKLMFTTTTPGLPPYLFDADTAVARFDQAYAAFPADFNSIPVFGPDAAGDGRVSFIETLCVP